jgi:hypothetical protein
MKLAQLRSSRVKRDASFVFRLAILPTTEAIKALPEHPDETNAILHVTC